MVHSAGLNPLSKLQGKCAARRQTIYPTHNIYINLELLLFGVDYKYITMQKSVHLDGVYSMEAACGVSRFIVYIVYAECISE